MRGRRERNQLAKQRGESMRSKATKEKATREGLGYGKLETKQLSLRKVMGKLYKVPVRR
jgi:hypothetical protein